MIETDFLFTLAEVAVAFVGFSAIVAALRQTDDGMSETEQNYMQILVERALAVVGFAMLPELLANLVFTDEQALKVSSALLSVYLFLVIFRSVTYHSSHRLVISIRTFWIRIAVSILVSISQLGNALDFNGGYLLGTYMMGGSFLLIAAGLSFVALLQTSPIQGFEEDSSGINCFGKKIS